MKLPPSQPVSMIAIDSTQSLREVEKTFMLIEKASGSAGAQVTMLEAP